jgi:hypothetical protein
MRARDGGFPEGLAAATARWRKTATGRRGCPPDQAAEDRSRPPAGRWSLSLSDEERFIGLQYRLAHKSLLDYLAGSAVLEVDPEVYARAGDPYQLWESVYDIGPEILAPVRQHIRDDVLGGHASLFRQVADDAAPNALPLRTALSALASARAVFDATWL